MAPEMLSCGENSLSPTILDGSASHFPPGAAGKRGLTKLAAIPARFRREIIPDGGGRWLNSR